MAYTHSVTRIVRIWGLAPLLAGLLLGGCVNDVTVQPEGANLLWKEVEYPGRQRANCIAIDPAGRIILGVYDYEREDVRSVGAISISSDNGETWAKKQLGYFEIVSLAIDSEGRIFAEGYTKIMRSLDHGESWETLGFRLNTEGRLRIVADSSDNLYLQTSLSGIYFSGDHGDSWTQIGEGIIAAGELTSLAVNSKGCLFAIAGQNLYRSCDRGASWTELQDVPRDRLHGQVAIDSKDQIFINNIFDLYRSTDDGATWTTLEPPNYQGVDEISIDGRDRLYALRSSRLYVSDDGGDRWALVLSLSSNYLGCIASNAAGDIFAVGMWGLSRSIDDGASWEMLGFSEYLPADITVDGNGAFYIGLASGGIYRSIDSLESWERFTTGLPDVRLNCLASANESILMAGTWNGIYVSPKDRPAWSLAWLAGYNTEKVFAFPGDSIAALATSLFISTDGGSNWSDIGLNGYKIRALIRTADGRLLAGANFGGVFRYTGEGILWDQMNAGLGDLRVNALAVTGNGDILAGTDTGIFISSNSGVSWRRFSKEKIQITAVLVVDEDIFFGTSKGILWTRTDGSALSPQNDGIQGPDASTIISLAVDPDDYLALFTVRNLYKSSQSTKELSPSGL